MNISVNEKKVEAIARMKLLGIFPPTIKQFENEGLVSISEPPVGAFYWAEGEDLERIRQFEQEHNALVYVVIRSYTNIGKMDSMLFVSDYRHYASGKVVWIAEYRKGTGKKKKSKIYKMGGKKDGVD